MLLDPRLKSDSIFVTDLRVCHIRLSHNAAFPWIFLIPNTENAIEIIDLSSAEQQLLMEEISLSSQVMRHLFKPKKLNVANLGNIVPQLHVHIIARYDHDKAWPGPVWNSGITEAYTSDDKAERIIQLKETFQHFERK